jgi:hypothetical protein
MKTNLLHKLPSRLLLTGTLGILICACDDEDPKLIPNIVTSTNITEVTTNSARGGGEIINNGNATITASGLVYSSIVTEPTISEDRTSESTTSGSFTSVIQNLSSGKKYYVRAYATNEVGTGYGNVITFNTGNSAPTVTNVSVDGTALVGEVLIATYSYSDSENDAEGGTTFQWYIADAISGANETAVSSATASTYTVLPEQFGKFFRVGITPKATTGTATGIEVKSSFIDGEPTTVTFTYDGKLITYGIVLSRKTGRKWLDRNLGAPNTPTSYDDYANYGDVFQWGRGTDGHQLTQRNGPNDADMAGVNGITNTSAPFEYSTSITPSHSKFIVIDPINSFDWLIGGNNNLWQGVSGANNPCPAGWRLATASEWTSEDLGPLEQAFSKLRITYGSQRASVNGSYFFSSESARYWTSSIGVSDPTYATRVVISTSSGATTTDAVRANGYPVRCIKDRAE